MKKFKLFFVALLVLTAAVCICACSKTAQRDPYTAYEITKVNIVQKGADSFTFTVTCDIAPGDTAQVYITRYDKLTASDTAISYKEQDGKFVFDAEVSYASYFIKVVDGDNVATLPMTRPQMAPALTAGEGTNVLTYNFVNGTSWSSFCDPTGKAVYRSASAVFDDSAEPVAQKVNISGVSTTPDNQPDAAKPYYYVVLSAKNGIVTYVSAPIMTVENAYSDLRVTLEEQDGTPILKVTGKFVVDGDVALELYSADTKLGRVVETLGQRVSGKAGEEFTVTIDASQVVNGSAGAGIWFDIKLATSSGSLYELSATSADMSQLVRVGKIAYEFKSWNDILKLNYQYYDYTVSRVEILEVDGVPTLVIEGVMDTTVLKDMKLHGDVDDQDILWSNQATEAGTFLYQVPLSELSQYATSGGAWVWFHLYTYQGNATVYSSKDDLVRGSLLTIGQSFEYDGVTYTIKAYEGIGSQLAIEVKK